MDSESSEKSAGKPDPKYFEELDAQARRNKMDARLFANLHPVTRVYCDGDGLIFYERRDAEPIAIEPGSPHLSRREALKRCHETTRAIRREMEKLPTREAELLYRLPISQSGFGLTYEEYYVQTYLACQESKRLEGELAQDTRALYSRGI